MKPIATTPNATLVAKLRYIADTDDAKFGEIDRTLREAADLIDLLSQSAVPGISQHSAEAMCDELAAIAVAVGRSKDGAQGATWTGSTWPARSAKPSPNPRLPIQRSGSTPRSRFAKPAQSAVDDLLAKMPPSQSAIATCSARETALADALQLVLDDWANGNTILDDAMTKAEAALNMPLPTQPTDSRRKEGV